MKKLFIILTVATVAIIKIKTFLKQQKENQIICNYTPTPPPGEFR